MSTIGRIFGGRKTIEAATPELVYIVPARVINNPEHIIIKQITKDFVAKTHSIGGWMWDDFAYISAAVLHAMAQHGVTGPNFEIGVYMGKYLATLHHDVAEYVGSVPKSYGMDVFWFCPEDGHRSAFKTLFGTTDNMKVITKNSTDTRAQEIIDLCGERPAFISIDGDHTVWPTLNDHVICADALKRGGVISSDDFCNWAMIGLMDGIARFFMAHNRHRIVPFVFSSNKLYSCHEEYHSRYQAAMI